MKSHIFIRTIISFVIATDKVHLKIIKKRQKERGESRDIINRLQL